MALISVDILSFSISNPTTLIVVRFIHGTIGGGLVGLGFSIIARTKSPDRIFGMLVAIQYTFGSIGIFTVPKLVGTFGPGAAFGALIAFSTITFLMVPFIPDYETKKVHQTDQNNHPKKILLAPAALGLLALFFFQSSNMGIADYAIELGKDSGFSIDYLSNMLTIANIIAISGALLVYVIGTRFGRAVPIVAGSGLAALFTFFFHWSCLLYTSPSPRDY